MLHTCCRLVEEAECLVMLQSCCSLLRKVTYYSHVVGWWRKVNA